MATYRQVYISFWQDSYILDLDPEGKLLYIYLLTNTKTTQCGIYELPIKIIQFETGLDKKTIETYIKKFVADKKILYSYDTSEIFLLNWLKYNSIDSPKVMACIKKELSQVKKKEYVALFIQIAEQLGYPIDELKSFADTLLIPYPYPIDTISIDYGEEKEKEEKEKEEEEYIEIYSQQDKPVDTSKQSPPPYKKIAELYNTICVSLPKVEELTDKRKRHIKVTWVNFKQDISKFRELFERAEASDFLSGRSGRWRCNFDWLIVYNNAVKVLEGVYDNKPNSQNTGQTIKGEKYDDEYAEFYE